MCLKHYWYISDSHELTTPIYPWFWVALLLVTGIIACVESCALLCAQNMTLGLISHATLIVGILRNTQNPSCMLCPSAQIVSQCKQPLIDRWSTHRDWELVFYPWGNVVSKLSKLKRSLGCAGSHTFNVLSCGRSSLWLDYKSFGNGLSAKPFSMLSLYMAICLFYILSLKCTRAWWWEKALSLLLIEQNEQWAEEAINKIRNKFSISTVNKSKDSNERGCRKSQRSTELL